MSDPEGGNEELLARDEVRPTEIDDLGPLLGVRKVADDQVNLPRLQERDPVRRIGADDLELDADLVGEGLREIYVVAHGLLGFFIDEPEGWVLIDDGGAKHSGLFNVSQLIGHG